MASAPTAAVLPSLSGAALIWGFLHSRVPGRKRRVASCFQIQVEIPLSAKDSSPVPSTPHGSANYMTSVRIGNLHSSHQLILPEACIEMPGIVSSATENYTGGGAVTDGMCTPTVSVQKHIHAYITAVLYVRYTRKRIYQYRESNLIHPASLKRGL